VHAREPEHDVEALQEREREQDQQRGPTAPQAGRGGRGGSVHERSGSGEERAREALGEHDVCDEHDEGRPPDNSIEEREHEVEAGSSEATASTDTEYDVGLSVSDPVVHIASGRNRRRRGSRRRRGRRSRRRRGAIREGGRREPDEGVEHVREPEREPEKGQERYHKGEETAATTLDHAHSSAESENGVSTWGSIKHTTGHKTEPTDCGACSVHPSGDHQDKRNDTDEESDALPSHRRVSVGVSKKRKAISLTGDECSGDTELSERYSDSDSADEDLMQLLYAVNMGHFARLPVGSVGVVRVRVGE
jgi:hypothetical protein